MRGLDLHWAGPYRPFQAYHFYAEMALTAENQREWHLAKALMDEAVFHIRKTKNRITTAIVLQMLATDCHMAGQSADALQFLAQAHEIFSSLRASPAVDELVASVQIEQASILCQEGQFASALTSLHSAKPYLSTQSQYRTWFQYYATLGEALQRSGSPDDSERALASAVHISEHLVSSLWDETRSFAVADAVTARVQVVSRSGVQYETRSSIGVGHLESIPGCADPKPHSPA
jgi:tetratricopeptide (TPR) repeat protein